MTGQKKDERCAWCERAFRAHVAAGGSWASAPRVRAAQTRTHPGKGGEPVCMEHRAEFTGVFGVLI
ncbi:hypothetical protein Srot_0031 [Segniliparus rotundus DSM 44985]|uniref:Uncharacterized protein n=1 Tax=Segniliparus rotundus (strain ATCC BAA-972 / CDC 1076 / CIP 108378 / DSM 44985 / JCM 13578) TaxID=640132 RepID=D6Z9J7_SEGRD|nr:hypothetical protein [Segniliparus rotundus]ADG96524.1 hypothetical protein Srot_0031 [Segniliparus rotundus DSM 44985]